MRTYSKTPYEIRLEQLFLARDICQAKHSAQAAASSPHMGAGELTINSAPTVEEIIDTAAKLNAFVSNDTQSA